MELNRWLVQRAKAAGFSAVVLTADALGPGQSDDFIRLGRPRPAGATAGNHDPALGGHGNFSDQRHDLSFADITFLREASGLPVLVKGVVHPDDIRESLNAGAAGIWISNHGGRQMDGGPASISLLRNAVDTVEGRVPVVLDSGIRRGIDVFRALALGATAVGIGRPPLWGLINGGSLGVKSVYGQLAAELRSTMLLSGVAKVTEGASATSCSSASLSSAGCSAELRCIGSTSASLTTLTTNSPVRWALREVSLATPPRRPTETATIGGSLDTKV